MGKLLKKHIAHIVNGSAEKIQCFTHGDRWSIQVKQVSNLTTLRDNPFTFAGKAYPWSMKVGKVVHNLFLSSGNTGAMVQELNGAMHQIGHVPKVLHLGCCKIVTIYNSAVHQLCKYWLVTGLTCTCEALKIIKAKSPTVVAKPPAGTTVQLTPALETAQSMAAATIPTMGKLVECNCMASQNGTSTSKSPMKKDAPAQPEPTAEQPNNCHAVRIISSSAKNRSVSHQHVDSSWPGKLFTLPSPEQEPVKHLKEWMHKSIAIQEEVMAPKKDSDGNLLPQHQDVDNQMDEDANVLTTTPDDIPSDTDSSRTTNTHPKDFWDAEPLTNIIEPALSTYSDEVLAESAEPRGLMPLESVSEKALIDKAAIQGERALIDKANYRSTEMMSSSNWISKLKPFNGKGNILAWIAQIMDFLSAT
ncbi:hypothetical protein COEREDRAFT_11918 [Coemansia reversa NRRL 1564]|uniref:Uncharacterized protein n=1 Tax=Coemansia reversa (strain ATCC 12441 / NRRL 1564) TaxID=763665 RepID=A0A2G5B1T7_COERN|nr:hypothetical protein COEREDRAFT_11918 [Coemansia reversa NRRL 1564]|eukprot:PIA12978.1 hypothetical protein COEREDRAFT_11918 [Coemansia reversa NRRL 1564]